jgi:hypothetical protein
VPFGKRALLVAKQNNVDELFDKVLLLPLLLVKTTLNNGTVAKVNWDVAVGNIEKTFGGPQIKQR